MIMKEYISQKQERKCYKDETKNMNNNYTQMMKNTKYINYKKNLLRKN